MQTAQLGALILGGKLSKQKKKKGKVGKLLQKLIGLYDADTIRLSLPQRDLGRSDQALYRFFEYFPYKKDPEDFSSLDVEYYLKVAASDGFAPEVLKQDQKYLRAFWNYLIDFLDFQGPNPASLRELSEWAKLRLSDPAAAEHSSLTFRASKLSDKMRSVGRGEETETP